jgi:hypothetical protein
LFSHTLSLCSSLSVRDQVSHPYKNRLSIGLRKLKSRLRPKERAVEPNERKDFLRNGTCVFQACSLVPQPRYRVLPQI